MGRFSIGALALAWSLGAQTLVVDRGWPSPETRSEQRIERDAKGFLGDAFRVGEAGETWTIDTIRVWAKQGASPACSRRLGDQLEKITLWGALDNPPVPGQPDCACHALVAIATGAMLRGSSSSANRNVRIAAADGFWQIDFQNLRWSVPGGLDVLFAVRGTGRAKSACRAGGTWALTVSPASAGYRLRGFSKDAAPQGFSEGPEPARWINVQVWARRAEN